MLKKTVAIGISLGSSNKMFVSTCVNQCHNLFSKLASSDIQCNLISAALYGKKIFRLYNVKKKCYGNQKIVTNSKGMNKKHRIKSTYQYMEHILFILYLVLKSKNLIDICLICLMCFTSSSVFYYCILIVKDFL